MDNDSGEFLLKLAGVQHVIVVLASRPPTNSFYSITNVWNHSTTKILELKGLSSGDMIILACKRLNVSRLSNKIVKIICSNSNGIPLWCEELVRVIVEMDVLENDVEDIPIPTSVAEMILARIDNMLPPEQAILKCATVIGRRFHRQMLRALVPTSSHCAFNDTLTTLARHGIIECFAAAEMRNRLIERCSIVTGCNGKSVPQDMCTVHCLCCDSFQVEAGKRSEYVLLDTCETLQFVHTYVQETVYNRRTKHQLQSLHTTAAIFLETETYKCRNCCGGAGSMVNGMHTPYSRLSGPDAATETFLKQRVFMGTSNIRQKFMRRSTVVPDEKKSSRLASIISKSGYLNAGTSIPNSSLMYSQKSVIIRSPVKSLNDRIKFGVNSADFFDKNINCQCNDILCDIYPQLVHHWKAAGNISKSLMYLVKAASVSVATDSNFVAISHLNEAYNVISCGGCHLLPQLEHAKLESLFGQVCISTILIIMLIY